MVTLVVKFITNQQQRCEKRGKQMGICGRKSGDSPDQTCLDPLLHLSGFDDTLGTGRSLQFDFYRETEFTFCFVPCLFFFFN